MLTYGLLDLPLILESELVGRRVILLIYGVFGAVEVRLKEF